MSRRPILLIACLTCVPLLLATTNRIYSWKDKDGVTHYTQIQPEKIPVKTRDVTTAKGQPVDAAAAKAKSTDEKACERAKLNAQVLKGPGKLMGDKDGDGKQEVLSDADRKAASELTDRQVAAYCGKSNIASP